MTVSLVCWEVILVSLLVRVNTGELRCGGLWGTGAVEQGDKCSGGKEWAGVSLAVLTNTHVRKRRPNIFGSCQAQ